GRLIGPGRSAGAAEAARAETAAHSAAATAAPWSTLSAVTEIGRPNAVGDFRPDAERFADAHVHAELARSGAVVIRNERFAGRRIQVEISIAGVHHIRASGSSEGWPVVELIVA